MSYYETMLGNQPKTYASVAKSPINEKNQSNLRINTLIASTRSLTLDSPLEDRPRSQELDNYDLCISDKDEILSQDFDGSENEQDLVSVCTSVSGLDSLYTQASLLSPRIIDIDDKTDLNERKIAQRQKQIDFGKNTIGYERYLALVPRDKRKRGDPMTPNTRMRCSKRCWDGMVRAWRRKLHQWDPPSNDTTDNNTTMQSSLQNVIMARNLNSSTVTTQAADVHEDPSSDIEVII